VKNNFKIGENEGSAVRTGVEFLTVHQDEGECRKHGHYAVAILLAMMKIVRYILLFETKALLGFQTNAIDETHVPTQLSQHLVVDYLAERYRSDNLMLGVNP